jgi:hypothetical protein
MRLPSLGLAALTLACAPSSPCRSGDARRQLARFSHPYAGHWIVARGDTLTLPEMGDRFRLGSMVLDTDTVSIGRQCLYRGQLTFLEPRADTLAVQWFGVPEHATVFGWPAELGPFAGINASWWGRDSLHGAILFDERMGVQVPPGVTAQFWAGRAALSSPEQEP